MKSCYIRNFWCFAPVMLVGCAATVTQASELDTVSVSFDRATNEYIQRCIEMSFPNTMAFLPGFDIEKHFAKLEQERRDWSQVFHRPAGVKYLEKRVSGEADEDRGYCLQQLLREAQAK